MANVRRKTDIISLANCYKVKAFKLLLHKAFEEEDARSLEAIINIAETNNKGEENNE